jgi:hypothetical protein
MQYLNEFHRRQHLLSKRMEKERSGMPPTSPQAFIAQVNRLRKPSQEAKSKNGLCAIIGLNPEGSKSGSRGLNPRRADDTPGHS